MDDDAGEFIAGVLYESVCLLCDLLLVAWAICILASPTGPRGEQLVIIYYWVIPIIMGPPAILAYYSWEKRFEYSRMKLALLNVPFVAAVGAWIWIASLPT